MPCLEMVYFWFHAIFVGDSDNDVMIECCNAVMGKYGLLKINNPYLF